MPSKQNEPRSRGNSNPTAEAGRWQAEAAIERGDYWRAMTELDRALTALERDRATAADLRRRWDRLALAARKHGHRVDDYRSQIIDLFCAVSRRVERAHIRLVRVAA